MITSAKARILAPMLSWLGADRDRFIPRKYVGLGSFGELPHWLTPTVLPAPLVHRNVYSFDDVGTYSYGLRSTRKRAKKIGICTTSGKHPASGLILFSW